MKWIVLLALALAIALLVLGVMQRHILFPRHALPAVPDVAPPVEGKQELWLDTSAGRVQSWFLPGEGVSASSPGPLLLFAHGNGELIDYWPWDLAPYRRMGISVLLPEYRGYGRSAGAPSQRAIADDFLSFYRMVLARPDVDPRRVVLHGRSLGGGAVCALLERLLSQDELPLPAGLILQSTFTSVADIANERLAVPRLFILDPFNNLTLVAGLGLPVLVMHGSRDEVVPYAHALRLEAALRDGWLVTRDSGHSDMPMDDVYWGAIRALLARAGVPVLHGEEE